MKADADAEADAYVACLKGVGSRRRQAPSTWRQRPLPALPTEGGGRYSAAAVMEVMEVVEVVVAMVVCS